MTDAIDRATVFKGECLLLRWGESHKGRTVTLQLDASTGGEHPFKGLKCGENGQRVMIAAVLIADDETPQAVPNAARGPRQDNESLPVHKGKRFSELPRSQQAAIKLQDPAFCAWLMGKHQVSHSSMNYETPDAFLKAYLGISSKKDLDCMETSYSGTAWDALLTDFDTRAYQR